MLKQTPLCSVNTFLLLKHCKQLFKSCFFVFFSFCEIQIWQNLSCTHNVTFFISYKCEIYRVFKFLIWIVDCKSQFVFVTKQINTNVFFVSISLKFFSHTGNSIPSQLRLLARFWSAWVTLSGYIFTGLIWLTWHHKKRFCSLFLMSISPFFELLNSTGNCT